MTDNINNSYDYDLLIPPGYYDEIHEKGHGIQSKWHHIKFKHVAEHIPPNASVLDIGCGSGTFIGNYLQSNIALGIDISPMQIDFANQKYGSKEHRFVTGSPVNMKFKDCSFDVISTIEMIEHISRKQVICLFKKAFSLLKPGGRLLITTPNYLSMWPLLQMIVNRVTSVSYGHQHINRYHAKKLRSDLKIAGFEKISLGSIHFGAPFFAFLNWKVCDSIHCMEQKFKCFGLGNLIFCLAVK